MFGWGRGSIQVLGFRAEEASRVRLSCTALNGAALLTDRAEIQVLFDSLNALQDTGNDLKGLPRSGSGDGGSVLYEIRTEFPDREPLTLCLASGSGEQPLSDLALAYWFYEKGKTPWIADTCRGSMAVFHQLFAAYVSQTGS